MKQNNAKEEKDASDQLLCDMQLFQQLIESQINGQKKIYTKCLQDFKKHLQKEAKQIEDSQVVAVQKNNLIEKTYELIYQNILQQSDQMLRNIRNTHEAKKNFWSQKIKEYSSQPSLQFKKQLYILKKDAQDRYQNSIQQRKVMKFSPFSKLLSQQQRNTSLAAYQNQNRYLQMNTNIGSVFKRSTTWLGGSIEGFDNKQNSMKQPLHYQFQMSQRQKVRLLEGQNSDFLLKFMKR